MKKVKIIATSGVEIKKIKEFESKNTAVDKYGIGSALVGRRCHFAGELIRIGDRYESKCGRKNSVEEGTIVSAFETVMIIECFYYEFAYLENIVDGLLSRMSSVATNCLEYIESAKK